MNLLAKSISINKSTKISLHPLVEQLTELIADAYMKGGQEAYKKSMNAKFSCHNNLPIHNVSLINKESNQYILIGGCFSPVFNLKNLNNDNTIFLNYKTSNKNTKPEHKKQVDDEFNQDIIDFIFMDFIRAISLSSLLKPGYMYPELRKITQHEPKYNSSVWTEVFQSEDYLLQKDFADLIGVTRDTVRKQSKF